MIMNKVLYFIFHKIDCKFNFLVMQRVVLNWAIGSINGQ